VRQSFIATLTHHPPPPIAALTHHPPHIDFRDERFGSRKQWGAYINLTTVLHRQTVAKVNEHIAQIRARLEQATQQYI
jgi:hypothetical protein